MKRLTSPKFLIFLTVLINMIGYGILFPILPLYEKAFNVGPFLLAAAMGAFPVAQFFAGPILGALSDRFGRRPLLIFSVFGTLIAFLLFAFGNNLWFLILGRLIDGISGGNISIAFAYMADITTKEKRTEGMGIISGAISLGFVFGPMIGGFLGQYGLAWPSMLAAGFALINLLLVIFFLPETEKSSTQQKAQKIIFFKEIFQALKLKKIGLMLILIFLLQMAWALHFAIFSLFLAEKFGLSIFLGGALFAYRGVVSAIVQLFLVGIAVKFIGETKLLKIAMPVMIIGLMMIGAAPSIIWLMVGITLMELGGDFIGPVANGLVSKWAKPEEQGEMMGIASSMSSLGRMFGPFAGGAMFQELGLSTPFLAGAAIMGLGLIMMFVL